MEYLGGVGNSDWQYDIKVNGVVQLIIRNNDCIDEAIESLKKSLHNVLEDKNAR